MLNSCSPGSLEFGARPGTGCLHDKTPIKPLGTESLMTFPGRHFTRSVTTAGGIKHVLGGTTGKNLLEACAWFPLNFTPCALALC